MMLIHTLVVCCSVPWSHDQ